MILQTVNCWQARWNHKFHGACRAVIFRSHVKRSVDDWSAPFPDRSKNVTGSLLKALRRSPYSDNLFILLLTGAAPLTPFFLPLTFGVIPIKVPWGISPFHLIFTGFKPVVPPNAAGCLHVLLHCFLHQVSELGRNDRLHQPQIRYAWLWCDLRLKQPLRPVRTDNNVITESTGPL